MKKLLSHLYAKAKMRPAGYVQDVLAHATSIDGTHYMINHDAWAKLTEKYGTPRVKSPKFGPPLKPRIAESANEPTMKFKNMEQSGPRLWKQLHLKMMEFGTLTVDNLPTVFKWLRDFTSMIPCATCASEWNDYIVELAKGQVVPLGSGLFDWSVDVHNRVNRKLGYSEMRMPDARVIYAVQEPKGLIPGSVENVAMIKAISETAE